MRGWILVAGLLVLGCAPEAPAPFQSENLGVSATFPGPSRAARFSEPTPFGTVEWFSQSWQPPGRLDADFHVAVGNLPPGDRGGTDPGSVLATYRDWLRQRLGEVTVTPLEGVQGPGFRYRVAGPHGREVQGILVVRRGRLHRAEATTPRPGDPRAQAFLDSFQVR